MNQAQLDRAVAYAQDAIARRLREGRIPAFVTLEGHLTLLMDRIQRWFSEGRNEKEVVGLAVEGLLALSMAMPPEVDVEALVARVREEGL